LPAGGGSVLRGAAGRGAGGVDIAWRWSGRERGEGGGPWCGVASAWQRLGRGVRGRPVAARQWRAAGSARRRSTWLTGGPGRDEAPSSLYGCGTGQRGEAVGAALIGGVGSTVRPIRFSNRIKFISNRFKFAPNFDRSKKVPSLAPKISNKICIERASDKEQLSL
jgi:hypothetical protein